MNSLILTSAELTMSSREIADLLGKQHSHLKISAERLAERGVIGTLAPREFSHNGNTYTEYLLNKRDSLILVAQNCPEFTARIVDRWQELEAREAPAIPKTFAAALRLAAEQQERIEEQAKLIEHQRPAVEFVDRYVEARSDKGLREVAKILGIKEREFIAELAASGVIFKQGSNWLPYAEHQHAGRFTVKTGEANGHAFHQMRFTPQGVAWVAQRFAQKSALKLEA